MVFNSYIFIIFFLPITIVGWYLINRISYRVAEVFLLAMSFWFYGYFNWKYLALLGISIVANFCISRLMHKVQNKPGKRILLITGLIFNIGLIFYFKYYDFFVENLNTVFHTDIPLRNIVLPLGISFFTFQQISFIVDSYRGEAKDYNLLEYAVFVAFFPQLVAGPIVLHSEFIPQLREHSNRKISWEKMAAGVQCFIIGLSKKMMVADVCGIFVDYGFEKIETISSPEAWLVMLCYTAQIYFDFSGYSDMAIGLGRMMGFELPMNFNSPYRALSINDFWSRWHITLTRFLRTYIYFPLGGSQRGRVRKYFNIMVVFLISGLWHGANWTFIVWGGVHGLLNIAERIFEKELKPIPVWIRWVCTYLFVSVLWLLFRADNIGQWGQMLGKMFSFEWHKPTIYVGTWLCRAAYGIAGFLPGDVMSGSIMFEMIMGGFILLLIIICLKGKNIFERNLSKYTAGRAIGLALICILLVFSLGAETQFIYFNF